ncbi:MAG TPA: serine/threonine-protein kinase, partial [Anaeromyxobacter sp.]
MGTVYLCEHAVLHRRFAVKVLRADHAGDEELVDRFRNEAIAASRIGQENVVDVVDFGADEDGSLYYVMEALEGRSLGAVIRDEGPLPVARALDLLEQICRALAAAHARGVVHRDVKPDNVFLVRRPDGSERAKVIDFGISRIPGFGERITRVGAIIGTPEYMAPEQASGASVDHRADVYAAGVLAFEMLTGGLPLEAPTPLATIEAHRTRTPDPPSRRVVGVPPEVDALVLRALAKLPEDRFATMDELAAEVVRIRVALSRELERGAPLAVADAAPRGALRRPSRPRGE